MAVLPSRLPCFHSKGYVSRSVSSAAQGKESVQFLSFSLNVCIVQQMPCRIIVFPGLLFLLSKNKSQKIDTYILYSHRGKEFFQASENVLSLMVGNTLTLPEAQHFRLKTRRTLFGFYLFSAILRFISGIAVQMNEYLSNVLLYERLTTTSTTKRMPNFPQMSWKQNWQVTQQLPNERDYEIANPIAVWCEKARGFNLVIKKAQTYNCSLPSMLAFLVNLNYFIAAY